MWCAQALEEVEGGKGDGRVMPCVVRIQLECGVSAV
jgi:hypothetical protein